MAELGITPASRSRVSNLLPVQHEPLIIHRVFFRSPDGTERDGDGNLISDVPSRGIVLSDAVTRL